MPIKVVVNGAFGRMGLVTQDAIREAADLELVGTTGRNDNLAEVITNSQADVVVDLTVPDAVFNNAQTILKCKARPVIGASGLTEANIQIFGKIMRRRKPRYNYRT